MRFSLFLSAKYHTQPMIRSSHITTNQMILNTFMVVKMIYIRLLPSGYLEAHTHTDAQI